MISDLFHNHEVLRLAVADPRLTAAVIYFGVAILVLLSFRRNDTAPAFLDPSVSTQLRGLAMILIVVGHVGKHLIEPGEGYPVFGRIGVSVFFLLSGYGLARSQHGKTLELGPFVRKRLWRVFVPYWLITFLILLLDFLLLDRTYSPVSIGATLIGINLSEAPTSLEYVRWFITALLFWYIVFIVLWRFLSSRRAKTSAALLVGLVLLPLSYYGPNISDSFLAFPVGMILSLYRAEIKIALSAGRAGRSSAVVALLLGTVGVFLLRAALPLLVHEVPFVLVTLSEDMLNTFVALCIILAFSGISAFRFGVLGVVGVLSFEIFLVHGLAMLKYDIVLWRGPVWVTFWPYALIVLAAANAFSYLVEKLRRFTIKKAPGS